MKAVGRHAHKALRPMGKSCEGGCGRQAQNLRSAQSQSPSVFNDSNCSHFSLDCARQPTYRHRTSLSVTSNNQRTLLNRRIPDSSSATTRPILRLADILQHSPQDELENNLPVEAQEQERHYTSNSRLRAGARAFKTFEKQSAAGSQRALHSASAQYLPSQNSAHDLRASPPRSSTNPNDGRDSSASHPPSSSMTSESSSTSTPAQHKPLVVGRTKPQPEPSTSTSSTTMHSSSAEKSIPTEVKQGLNHEIAENVKSNTVEAAPADPSPAAGKKKEKAPKQPKQPKAAPPSAPLTPALIDLRVGHILRAIAHPNADSLYVSTIAMGDPEGTEHTQVDEETGKVVRTVCSGLNGLVPLEEMQNRKIVVVANLKPVNMRSIKSAAMVLAASPPAEEGADPHAADRVVELVNPPEGAEAGDPVFFEGWPYGEGRGPEKQLNPKKKQWEAIQPGFFTSEDLVVGFDAAKTEIGGAEKGDLIVAGKGKCTVTSLKGAVVR